jgi:peptidoglycan/LPS O-acetylase OafA/YrhL
MAVTSTQEVQNRESEITSAPTTRIFFVDNLRAFVVVLVVVLHGAMVYMVDAPPWWYVIDAQSSLFFTILVILVDVPIMLIMFYISGHFALPSLVKRGPEGFLKEKFIRIGAPWIFGVLFLAPLTAYIYFVSRGIDMSYLEYWSSTFWSTSFQQSVYWFLGILMLLFFLLVLAYDISERLRTAQPQLSRPGWKFFTIFWALMSLGMLILMGWFPIDTWFTNMRILVFQPLRLPLYFGYFVLGIYAYLNGWFRPGGYSPRLLPWAAIWLGSGLLYLANRIFVLPNAADLLIPEIGHALLFNAFCLSSLMAGIALFQQKVNIDTPFWQSLSTNSYGIYYIHPLILYPLALLARPFSLPLFLKAPLVIISAILLSWVVSAFFLTKAPIVRRVFG